jgi:hypothetical protein
MLRTGERKCLQTPDFGPVLCGLHPGWSAPKLYRFCVNPDRDAVTLSTCGFNDPLVYTFEEFHRLILKG